MRKLHLTCQVAAIANALDKVGKGFVIPSLLQQIDFSDLPHTEAVINAAKSLIQKGEHNEN